MPSGRIAIGCLLAAFGAALIAGGAAAQSYHFVVDSNASSISTSIEIAVPMDGFFIGDFDAVTNPGGTRTLPGLFGGSGNNEIPVTIDFVAGGADQTMPFGEFDMDVDGLTFAVRGLFLDALNEQPLSIALTANLLYSSFHTVAPTAIFPGGVVLPLPLGQASIVTLAFTQSGAGGGVLTPTGTPDEFTFTMLVPAEANVEVEVLGQVQSAPAAPIVLALAGTITIPATGDATLSASNEVETMTPLPAPPTGIEAQPVDIPTVLPPGSTAHLLLTADILEGSADVMLETTLIAVGTEFCRADVNGDGELDFFDFLAFQNLFAMGDPLADFNNDGALDFFDFLAFQNAFAAGCA